MKYILVVMSLFFLTTAITHAEETRDLFKYYNVKEIFRGGKHAVVLRTKQDHLMRTALRGGYELHRVEFAGHYIVLTIGCGAACFGGAVVDAITGNVTWFPFLEMSVTDYFEPVSYCRNSRLIRFVGETARDPRNAAYFYELRNDQFRLVKTVLLPPPRDGLIGDPPKWQDMYSSNPAYCTPVSETPRNYL